MTAFAKSRSRHGETSRVCSLSGAKRTSAVVWLALPRSRMTQRGHEPPAFAATHGPEPKTCYICSAILAPGVNP